MGKEIYMRDFVVKILVRLGLYKPIVELINRVKETFQARCVRHLGLETLREANVACEEVNVIMFPAFGTLLGAIREKGFISYDIGTWNYGSNDFGKKNYKKKKVE